MLRIGVVIGANCWVVLRIGVVNGGIAVGIVTLGIRVEDVLK